MPTRTRSLAPKTRSGRVRNVSPVRAVVVAVILAAALRKSRRVPSDSDARPPLLSGGERVDRPATPGWGRISVMENHAEKKDERAPRRYHVLPVLPAVARKLFETERIRGEQTVRSRVPV